MDIPPGGFFTPKRPSFRMPVAPQSRSGHGRRHLYTPSISHPNRRSYGYQNNFSPGFVNGHHGRSMYHEQNPRCYIDRFGRAREYGPPIYPVMRVFSNFPPNYEYPPISPVVFALTPDTSGGPRGNGDNSKNDSTTGGTTQAEKSQNGNTQSNDEETATPSSSRTSGDSGNPMSPPSGSNADAKMDGTSDDDPPPVDSTLKNQGASQHQMVQQPQHPPPDSHLYYNYNSPAEDSQRRRRQFPTQIPIQAIHYNDDMNQGWNMNERLEQQQQEAPRTFTMPQQQSYLDQSQQQQISRGFEASGFQQQPPGFPSNAVFVEQQQNNFPEHAIQHGVPYPNYTGPQPSLEQMTYHPNPNIMHPAMQYCAPNQPPMYYGGPGGHPYKLIDVAREGYQSFQNDYKETETQAQTQQGEPSLNPNEPVKTVLPKVKQPNVFDNIRFDVDHRLFVDNRPILNLVPEGGKEYKLFEDQMNPVRDIIREIYNVNEMDPLNIAEICGMKVLPQNLLKWPLDIIGANWAGLRKRIVNFNGEVIGGNGARGLKEGQVLGAEEDGHGGRNGNNGVNGSCGSYGVSALAKLFFQGEGGAFPQGYATFVGMNVDKLVKDLDNGMPITPGFPGPHADRNHTYDSGWTEVVGGGVKEYDLPFDADAASPSRRNHEAFEWTMKHRIKRSMFTSFSFEILLFIFYTFTGDALQLLAAKEMFLRGWRFHKIFQVWITPWVSDCTGEKSGITENGEWVSGIYKFFHYGKWQFSTAPFKINEYLLEGRPVEVKDALWE